MRRIHALACVVWLCLVPSGVFAQTSKLEVPRSRAEGSESADAQEGSKNPEEYLLPSTEGDKTTAMPEPYGTDELAPWAYFTVRFAAVTVGSFPFSILIAGVGFDTYRTIVESNNAGAFEPKYLPLFFGGAEKPQYTSDEVGTLLWTALGVSLGVGTIDLIIGLVKYFRQQEINELFLSETQ